MEEISNVVSPGARQAAWPIKIVSHVALNVYVVRAVVIGPQGTTPLEIGDALEAVNLGERFDIEGELDTRTYAIMFKTQEMNYFYSPPWGANWPWQWS